MCLCQFGNDGVGLLVCVHFGVRVYTAMSTLFNQLNSFVQHELILIFPIG